MVPTVTAHPFLSPDWIAAVAAIRDDYDGRLDTSGFAVRANVTVTDVPFAEPTIEGHIDTTGGVLSLEVGHLSDSDFTIELSYDTAHRIFVDRDPQAMAAILVGGEVKLTGDSSKILGLAGLAAPPEPGSDVADIAREVVRRIDAVTEKPR